MDGPRQEYERSAALAVGQELARWVIPWLRAAWLAHRGNPDEALKALHDQMVDCANGAAMAHALGFLHGMVYAGLMTELRAADWLDRLRVCPQGGPGVEHEGGRTWCAYCGDVPRTCQGCGLLRMDVEDCLCGDCRRKDYEAETVYLRKAAERRLQAGLCVNCAMRDFSPELVLCPVCLKSQEADKLLARIGWTAGGLL